MSDKSCAIYGTGFVSSVGLNVASSCAAIRSKLSNPSITRFINRSGDWVVAHCVPLMPTYRGRTKLLKMAVMAILECLSETRPKEWSQIPLFLCLGDPSRPGRNAEFLKKLQIEIKESLGGELSQMSRVFENGRASAGIALTHARRLLSEGPTEFVVIAAVDGLVDWTILREYDRADRLLTADNSNGFMPGEGAAAIMIGRPDGLPRLCCLGLGIVTGPEIIGSDQPLRGDALANAFKAALIEAECSMHEVDLRISDLSGEQYYFKEAALAVSRTLRVRTGSIDLWHPAECIGETGSVSGVATIIVADTACRKGYSPGPRVICHASADTGQRVAMVLEFRDGQ